MSWDFPKFVSETWSVFIIRYEDSAAVDCKELLQCWKADKYRQWSGVTLPNCCHPSRAVFRSSMSAVAVRGTNSLFASGCVISTHIQEEVFAKLSITCIHLKYKYSRISFCDHFYDPFRVGPSTPDLGCNTVATQASFLYLMRF